MLNVFQRQEVWNVCCVVTRYFGGVLLGAGGLTRAYTKGATDALTAAGIARMGLWTLWDVPCTYPLLERMKLEVAAAGHPELSLLRVTPTMIDRMSQEEKLDLRLTGFGSPERTGDAYEGFADLKGGAIRLTGLPDETLRHDYLLAVRALRFAANFDLPIEPNTWLAIVRASARVLDYVPATDIMDEWRKVAAESMYRFVRLL